MMSEDKRNFIDDLQINNDKCSPVGSWKAKYYLVLTLNDVRRTFCLISWGFVLRNSGEALKAISKSVGRPFHI